MKRFFTIGKLLGFYGVVTALLFLWDSGYDAARHHYFQMVFDIVIALFSMGFIAIMVMEAWDKKLHDLAHNAAPKIAKDLVAALDEAFGESPEQLLDKAVHQHDHDMLNAILADMDLTGDKVPTDEQFAKIAEAFHENTERYVQFTPDGNGKFVVEFAARPFEHVPGRSQAHEEARVRGDKARATKIPVRDGDEPEKPLTKSQQRRLNAKKGYGPLTDDEVREQKNAKRRAARAAKKAAEDTTSTTTQPGQTKLI